MLNFLDGRVYQLAYYQFSQAVGNPPVECSSVSSIGILFRLSPIGFHLSVGALTNRNTIAYTKTQFTPLTQRFFSIGK